MGIPIPEFKVLLYGPELHQAGLRARARFEGNILAVIAHGKTLMVPAHRLSLKTGGFDGRQRLIVWVAEDGTYSIMLQGEDALEAFIQLAPREIGRQLFRARNDHTHTGRRLILGVALLAFLSLLLMGMLWVNADRLSQWAVSHITREQEQQLGELAFAQMRPSLKLAEPGTATAAVEAIGKRLTAESDYHYQFHVAVDPQINAFALPGGQIMVYTGLLKAADSATEVAGVLAHQISHVEKRHALRNLAYALGWRAALGVALSNFSSVIWGDLASRLGSLNYSQELETEADMEGLEILRRAGIATNGAETFFAKMAAKGNAPPHLLDRHPAGEERLATLRAAIARQPTDAIYPLRIDWEQVKSDL